MFCTITGGKCKIFVELMYLADGKHKSISELVKIKSYLTGQNPFLWESDRNKCCIFGYEWFCECYWGNCLIRIFLCAVLYCFINQSWGPLGKQREVLEEPCDLILGESLCFKNNYSGWEINDKLSWCQETFVWNRETEYSDGDRRPHKCPHYS